METIKNEEFDKLTESMNRKLQPNEMADIHKKKENMEEAKKEDEELHPAGTSVTTTANEEPKTPRKNISNKKTFPHQLEPLWNISNRETFPHQLEPVWNISNKETFLHQLGPVWNISNKVTSPHQLEPVWNINKETFPS